ncbi:MAG TPA: hypothetical protein VFM04_02665, partial [Candidatus Methylomirabilis sp.]|nr:hypothetical protein [Candidatus Methylomirabilis sp.]
MVSQSYSRGVNDEAKVERGTVLRSVTLDRSTEDAILALAPQHLSEVDIVDVLSHGPAPRIINLDGSVPIVTMKS